MGKRNNKRVSSNGRKSETRIGKTSRRGLTDRNNIKRKTRKAFAIKENNCIFTKENTRDFTTYEEFYEDRFDQAIHLKSLNLI